MEVAAKLKHARLSAQKGRLVADQIRGLEVDQALDLLKFSTKRASKIIRKVLESAMANAEFNEGLDIDNLKVSTICVDEGPVMKRMKARAKGRGMRINKQTCHITIKVKEIS